MLCRKNLTIRVLLLFYQEVEAEPSTSSRPGTSCSTSSDDGKTAAEKKADRMARLRNLHLRRVCLGIKCGFPLHLPHNTLQPADFWKIQNHGILWGTKLQYQNYPARYCSLDTSLVGHAFSCWAPVTDHSFRYCITTVPILLLEWSQEIEPPGSSGRRQEKEVAIQLGGQEKEARVGRCRGGAKKGTAHIQFSGEQQITCTLQVVSQLEYW